MLGYCKNGHLTGQRHCGNCGADRVPSDIGTGKVLTPAHQIDRNTSELRKLRRATQFGGRIQGPNKVSNAGAY